METIFFAYFESGISKHDRMEYFQEQKTLDDFFEWCEAKRHELEVDKGTNIVLVNFKVQENLIISNSETQNIGGNEPQIKTCVRCGNPVELVDNVHCKQCQVETSRPVAS